MRRGLFASLLLAAAMMVGGTGARADPWADGVAAYNRGDYLPAIELFRPLARAGNARAQALIGVMYRRGQGVAKSPAHAFLWLSRASANGDAKARAELHDVSLAMTAEELAQAREMMQACEASDYRSCEY